MKRLDQLGPLDPEPRGSFADRGAESQPTATSGRRTYEQARRLRRARRRYWLRKIRRVEVDT